MNGPRTPCSSATWYAADASSATRSSRAPSPYSSLIASPSNAMFIILVIIIAERMMPVQRKEGQAGTEVRGEVGGREKEEGPAPAWEPALLHGKGVSLGL